jgi:hypothetical protein
VSVDNLYNALLDQEQIDSEIDAALFSAAASNAAPCDAAPSAN